MESPPSPGAFGHAAERLATLQQLTAALAKTCSYEQVAHVIITEALPLLRAEVGVVALLSEDGRSLKNVGFQGVDAETRAEWAEYPVESLVPVAEAARTHAPVIVPTLEERNARYPVLAAVHGLEHGGPVVAFPLEAEGKPRGVLAFCWGFALAFRDEDLSFLRTLAEHCALAIERARLYAVATNELAVRKASEQQLREASARKDEFLAMLAHELRNPLAPIAAAADLLALVDDSRVANAQAVIRRQTDHLRRLVDDLLDAARAVQGRLTLQLQPVDVVALVRTTAFDHAEVLASAKLSLEVRVPPAPIWTRADKTRLVQALSNLLHNARKFSPPNSRVSVLFSVENGVAQLEVRDEGGVEPQLLPQLFEPFAQGDRSLARTAGGLGLGLAIVRAIARLHGGDAVVESAGPGTGAVFRVTFPVVEVERLGVDSSLSWPAASSRRVLVVEDNPDAAQMMALLIEAFGHQVKFVHHANDALQVLDSWNAQVVLSDIGLPDVDGYALAEQIRRRGNPTFRPLLVAVSGYGRDTDRARAMAAGFDHYLTKPVDSRALANVLANP
jgi:signal transduction histidine kinase